MSRLNMYLSMYLPGDQKGRKEEENAIRLRALSPLHARPTERRRPGLTRLMRRKEAWETSWPPSSPPALKPPTTEREKKIKDFAPINNRKATNRYKQKAEKGIEGILKRKKTTTIALPLKGTPALAI